MDAIHSAIATNHKIRFQYFQWNIKKQMELRHDGQFYEVISSQFFGWVFALGMGVKILSPSSVVERMKQEVDALHELYGR